MSATRALGALVGLLRWAGLLGLLLLLAAAPARAFVAIVTHVTDGDTVWVQRAAARGRESPPLKLRLQGIDAPERCQPWGAQATAALTHRVLHRRVQVHTRASDDYGRALATLRLDGEDINAWLVAQGHAWNDARGRRGYAVQEREARAARRGLFAAVAPERPRDFRRRHGPCG